MTSLEFMREQRLAAAVRAEVAQALVDGARVRARRLAQAIGSESPPEDLEAASCAQRVADEAGAVAAAAMADLRRLGEPFRGLTFHDWLGVSVEDFNAAVLAAMRTGVPEIADE